MKRFANMFSAERLRMYVKYIPLIILLLDSCIEPFHINVANQQGLVVDGLFSDQIGPQVIKIFKTFDLQLPYNQIQWVTGANVSVYDELDAEIKLIERTPGNYHTDSAFQGVVGKSYKLKFTTTDGDVYESDLEKMIPVGDIDSVHYVFEKNADPATTDHGYSANGFKVEVDASVLPEQQGLVRWRWTGTFGLKTYPELKTKPSDAKVPTPIPDPPACSGYDRFLQYMGPCTCCHCYVTQTGDVVTISDQNFIKNGKITGQDIVFIQANRRFLYEKYYLLIQQMSISPGTYAFWQKVAAQQSEGSNLFQTPPAPTLGNVHLVTGSIPVSGVFSVSSIKTKEIIFTRDNVPYTMLPIDTIPASCRVAYSNSSTKKPSFW